MTNEEAICLIGNIQFDLTDGYYQRKDYIEALCVFDKLNQENTKLKAEIEQLKEEVERYKKLIPKMCENCEYEDLSGCEEPCDRCFLYSNWKLKCEVSNE